MKIVIILFAFYQAVEGVINGDISFNETTAAVGTNVTMRSPMPKYATSSSLFKREDGNRRQIVTILTSINYGGWLFPIGPICTEATVMALDRLRLQNNWLPNYELVMQLIDDECDDAPAITGLTQLLRNGSSDERRLPVVIASSCPPLAQITAGDLMAQYNLMGLLMVEGFPAVHYNRDRFGRLFPLSPSADAPYLALAEFIYKMGWRKVAILSERNAFFDAMDASFISACDMKNITVTILGKVTYMSTNAEEMSSAWENMAAKDPRIIVSSSDMPLSTACWSYRNGLYGPNTAIFFLFWNFWDKNSPIPDYIADWCTPKMLEKVHPSAFFFGDASKPQLSSNASTIVDSTGLSYPQFLKELSNRVPDGEENPNWEFWHTTCYEQTIFLGYLLNKTETLLARRGETLMDWTTGSKNFAERPEEIYRILEESLYNISVTGFKGDYSFDKRTTVNSKGFTPMVIAQVQGKEVNQVAYYKGNDEDKLHVIPRIVVWRTVDGLPIHDSVRVVQRDNFVLSEADFAGFVAIGAIGIVSLLATMAKIKWNSLQRNTGLRFDSADFLSQLGGLILFAHVFVLPNGSRETINQNCIAVFTLIVIGCSLTLSGIVVKVESAVISDQPSSVCHFSKKILTQTVAPVVWTAWNALLLAVLFSESEMYGLAVLSPTAEMSTSDNSIAFRAITYKCTMASSVFGNVVLAIIVTGQILLLMRGGFRTFQIKSKLGRNHQADFRRARICLACELSILLAACLIVALGFSNFRFLLLTLSCTFCVLPAVNLLFFLFTEAFKPTNVSSLSFSAPAKSPIRGSIGRKSSGNH